MASIEKLVKSFEALKVIHTPVDKPEEAFVSTKFIKKEVSLTKKDKVTHCSNIADIICAPQLRSIEDFHKFLGIAIETFLSYCDDSDADVRLRANECLNRVIKNLLESQLVRIEVELYKEVKKNGTSRSLRAALSRFADLSHLIKPSKCRPFLANLFPCLIKISKRTDEDAIQECLGNAINKIMPAFGKYATDSEVIAFLKAFLVNLPYVMASVRRTSATSLVAVCQYSKKPMFFTSWLLNSLIEMVNEARTKSLTVAAEDDHDRLLVGVFLCVKHLIPLLTSFSVADSQTTASFGISAKQRDQMTKELAVMSENLAHLYELICYSLRYNTDHSVVLSALEALQQILRTPPKVLLPIIIDEEGIINSRLGEFMQTSVPASPSVAHRKLRGVNSDSSSEENVTALEYEEEIVIKGQMSSEPGEKMPFKHNLSKNSIQDSLEASFVAETSDDDLVSECGPNFTKSMESLTDSVCSTVPPTPVKSAKLSRLQLMKLTYVDSEDVSLSPDFHGSPMNPSSADFKEVSFRVGNIGDFTTKGICSLEYCTRLLSCQFLLTGVKGGLMPDRNVRVSVKSVALSCMAAIIQLLPRAFVIDLHLDDSQNVTKNDTVQKIWDIALFSAHSDPHLRGQVALVVSSFLNCVLRMPSGYTEFLMETCSLSAFAEAPSLEELVNSHLLRILLDAENSSVSIRSGLQALQTCLIAMIESNESLNSVSLSILQHVIQLKSHNYWLVKVELLELLSSLPFKGLYYLEKSGLRDRSLSVTYFQEVILDNVFLPMLADDDYRVRQAAASSLVKITPNLFIASDYPDGDAITALAAEKTATNLKCFTSTINSHTVGVFPTHLFPATYGFVVPFANQENSLPFEYNVERNLRLLVQKIQHFMILNVGNKRILLGCCLALDEMARVYLVTKFPRGWGCDISVSSNSAPFVKFLLNLFSNSPTIVLDLSAHQRVLRLVGNLLSGLCFQSIKSSITSGSTLNESESDWGLISKDALILVTFLESLTFHLLKLLNMFACVVEESTPTPAGPGQAGSSAKTPVMQSLSSASLSPIRKRSVRGGDAEKGEAPSKKSEKEKAKLDKNQTPSPLSEPLLAKLFEIMKASHSSGKISMDVSGSKLLALLQVALNVMSQVLEVATLKYFGKYAEQLLEYLKVVIMVSPPASVQCVRQLLKCIFGTNLSLLLTTDAEEDDLEKDVGFDRKPGKATRVGSTSSSFTGFGNNCGPSFGLYQTCISFPYTQFSQFYSSKLYGQSSGHTLSDAEELCVWQVILRKSLEKRVSSLLDKTMIGPNNQPSSTKSALTSHIRLFEPVVIKALKIYTVTSDVELQCQVLSILAHLIKLRVNYCLLDADQVFIGFVQKQFEFIESGLIERPDSLIFYIFNFLMLLSYERHHSNPKPIIGVPKIIQMCDGLMASGQKPDKYVIPALVPVVEDLFLLRSPTKVESAKELEAQREVIVSTLLKLASFPKALELLLLIIHQSRKEGDEKWKKVSRLVIDVFLPLLAKQMVNIDDYRTLELVHRLFESVSPVVFRPVDFLLKTLFAPPRNDFTENRYIFQRWLSLVLVVIRVLMVQAKEDVVLARLDELNASAIVSGPRGLPVINMPKSNEPMVPFQLASLSSVTPPMDSHSEEMFAEYLLQVVDLCISELLENCHCLYADQLEHNQFLVQLLSSYFLYLTHMFQSGSYRRVAKSAAFILKSTYNGNFDINALNASFAGLDLHYPTLVLQWANILMLLGYDDNGTHEFWYKLIKRSNYTNIGSPARSSSQSFSNKGKCPKTVLAPNLEMIRRGTLVLLCDFICENISDAEQMTWLIVNNIQDIIRWSYELPIKDFIHAVHRNAASSGLFLQAINARCDDLHNPAFLKRVLSCLEYVHPTQSGPLAALVVEKIVTNPQTQASLKLRLAAAEMACNRLHMVMKSENPEELSSQLPLEDVNKLISVVDINRHKKLYEALQLYRTSIGGEMTQNHPLLANEVINNSNRHNIGKDWFLSAVKSYCRHSRHYKLMAQALNKLNHEELTSMMFEKEFHLTLLGPCIEAGLVALSDAAEKSSKTNPMFSAVMNRNTLLKASTNAIVHHLAHINSLLPTLHHGFFPHSEVITPKEAKHRDRLLNLFEDVTFREFLFSLSSGFTSFFNQADSRRNGFSGDTLKATLRVGVLFAEAGEFLTEKNLIEHITLVVKTLSAFCRCDLMLTALSDVEHVTYLYSLITATHSLIRFVFGEIQMVKAPESFGSSELANPEWKHAHKVCLRMSELILFLENCETAKSEGIPSRVLMQYAKPLILSLARIPLVNAFVLVPPSLWKLNLWSPNFIGDFGTICPTVPSEHLRDVDLLSQFIFRVKLIGWTSRVQFEEFWMSLLGVVSILQTEQSETFEEQNERTLIAGVAVKGITGLLLQSLLMPQAGNPVRSHYTQLWQTSAAAFLHTKYGEKLRLVRSLIFEASRDPSSSGNNFQSKVNLVQMSVEYIRRSVGLSGATETSPSISPGSSSTSSSSIHSPLSQSLVKCFENPLPFLDHLPYRSSLEIDLHSCIHFLLDHYGQIIASSQTQSPLLVEVCKSLLYLSDLFFERSQFEWMLDTFLELYRTATIAEDEILLQYLVYGICKSAAVLGIDQDQVIEKCKKSLESGLKSSFLSTRICSLYGLCYLFEQKNVLPGGKETMFLPVTSDYLLKHLSDSNLPSSHNKEHVLIMWKLSFHLIEHFVEEFTESDFGQKVFQLSLKVLASDETSIEVYETVVSGLERLLICEVFAIKDADLIVRTAIEKLRVTTESDALGAFRIVVASIYVFGLSIGNDTNSEDAGASEELLAAMEKIGVIFDRLKICGPKEALAVCCTLPLMLCEFFPSQDVLNKIIGEFLSSQQLYPQYLANIIFKVFGHLSQQSKEEVIHDWVILSLSSFTQLEPLSLAVWSLSIFLVSATSNQWIRNMFPCLQDRLGKYEEKDKEMLCTICCVFYSELKREEHREAFMTTIQGVAKQETPYADVITFLQQSHDRVAN